MDCLCDVIVLTWNQKGIIMDFIESFFENTDIKCRLIIIDNGSNDGTSQYLESLRDTANCKFKIILNKENLGFVKGMNQGISESTSPYICLANNDLIFTKNWLSEIISIFEKYKEVGLINPNSNNLGIKPQAGQTIEDLSKKLYSKYKGIFVEMPFVIGFCMVIKREVLEKVGGLSEEFCPMFFEDTDYSLKVVRHGFRIGVAKGSYVWHKEHASFKHWPQQQKEMVFIKSKETFTKKWGRILRIAWIEESFQELLKDLETAVKIVRQGNYLNFLVKNLIIKEPDEIFNKVGLFEHAGIRFINFRNLIELYFKIVTKKKRYDIIITKNKFYKKIFKNFNLLDYPDEKEIKRIKFS